MKSRRPVVSKACHTAAGAVLWLPAVVGGDSSRRGME